jgi:tetratricopeptide (TPR) repeat protein
MSRVSLTAQVEDTLRRATTAFNAGRRDEARRLCEAGLTHTPDEPALHHLLAAILFADGQPEAARKHIETSLRARPGHPQAQLLAARILDHLGDRPARRAAWQAVRKTAPQNREAMARLGRLLWEDGDATAAAQLLTEAVGADAPASAWFDLALARQDLRDFAGAEAAYKEVLTKKPDHAEAAVNLGVARQEAGDLDGAMDAYAQAYRLRPATFGTIAMALTSGSHGRLWLDEDALRKSLGAHHSKTDKSLGG